MGIIRPLENIFSFSHNIWKTFPLGILIHISGAVFPLSCYRIYHICRYFQDFVVDMSVFLLGTAIANNYRSNDVGCEAAIQNRAK